jgi:HPt (histidine-containing phosphotransfer) domain-containing protein
MYRDSGLNDCLGKPFTSQELWRCLVKYLKPVRWQKVNEHIQSEDEFRQKLAVDFVKNNRTKVTEIVQALKTGDIKLAHRMAHNLKSNAGHLDKTVLQQAAADVEYHLANNENLVTEEHLKVLEKELNAALTQFSQELDTETPQREWHYEGPPPDAKYAQELFARLEPLLDMGSPECRKFIDKLQHLPGSEALIQQLDDLDFEQALLSFAELKKVFKETQ